ISPRTTPMATRLGVTSDARSTSAAFTAEEHGAHEVAALEQVVCRTLEAHLTLLEEDGAVGHRQCDVQRLLDDEHRLAPCLQLLDRRQQTLHHDRRQPERELVDEQDLGLV